MLRNPFPSWLLSIFFVEFKNKIMNLITLINLNQRSNVVNLGIKHLYLSFVVRRVKWIYSEYLKRSMRDCENIRQLFSRVKHLIVPKLLPL